MVKIRLMRMGARNQPFYRVIVVDSKAPRDGGRVIEWIGTYEPGMSKITIDLDKFTKWISNGAQPTDSVKRLVKQAENQNNSAANVG